MHRFGPYYVQPIVAALKADGTPIIATYDSIGTTETKEPIQVGGSARDMLLGCAETFFQPGMGPEKLMETTAQVLTSGQDRDSASGWGGLVYLL